MTPSEITLHASEINSFKAYMLEDFAKFSNVIANEIKQSVDTKHIEYDKQKLQLAEAYIQIMLDFFAETREGDTNIMTTEEFYDIVRHLNKLLNNLYWIDLD